jgi:hypothetical protein
MEDKCNKKKTEYAEQDTAHMHTHKICPTKNENAKSEQERYI